MALGATLGLAKRSEPKWVSFFDERGDEKQREALQMIFMGKAGGFRAEFAKFFGEIRGVEFAPIEFKIAGDLAYRSAEIPARFPLELKR